MVVLVALLLLATNSNSLSWSLVAASSKSCCSSGCNTTMIAVVVAMVAKAVEVVAIGSNLAGQETGGRHYHTCWGGNSCHSSKSDRCGGSTGSRRIAWELWW